MRALLIDPTAKAVTVIDHSGEYESIKASLGCEWIEGTALGGNIRMWVNEEGLLAPKPGPFFRIAGNSNTFAGKGLVLAYSDYEPEADEDTILDLPDAVVAALQPPFVSFPDCEFLGFEDTEGVSTHPIFGSIRTLTRKALFSDKVK